MRGWNDALDAVQNGKFIINDDRKIEPSNSEKPNDCDYAENPSGDVWECSCYQTTICEHQQEDYNPDGTINIVECKTEPQTEVETMSCAECKHRPIGAEICEEACHYEPQTDWHYDEQDATWYPYKHEDEPQQKSCATCKHALGNWDGESNNCGRCCGADRRFYEPKTEPQTYITEDRNTQILDAWQVKLKAEQTEPQTSEPLTCRNKEHYETCEYSDNCIPSVCLKAFNEFSKMLDEAVEQTEPQTEVIACPIIDDDAWIYKDEPQRNMAEDIVESFGFNVESYRQAKAKDEPQRDYSKCYSCNKFYDCTADCEAERSE